MSQVSRYVQKRADIDVLVCLSTIGKGEPRTLDWDLKIHSQWIHPHAVPIVAL